MTQHIAKFMLKSAERDAIKYALIKEFPLADNGETFHPATIIYQALPAGTGNMTCKWPAHNAYSLLNRLLAACSELDTSSGKIAKAELYPSWRGLKKIEKQELRTACFRISVSLDYPLAR